MYYIEIFFKVLVVILYFFFVFLFIKSLINTVRYKVPQVGTFSSDFKVMKEGLLKYELGGKKIADLGSGSGKVLRFFEKKFKMKTTGYEIDFLNIIISRFLNYIFKTNAKIIKGNYLKKDLSNFDVFYVYGFKVLMPGIEKKLWGECKKGTLIISNAFKMPNKKPIEVLFDEKGIEEIYVYKV